MPERTIVFDSTWEADLWDRVVSGVGLRLVDRRRDGTAIVQASIAHELSEVDVIRTFLRARTVGDETLLDEYERERDAIWKSMVPGLLEEDSA